MSKGVHALAARLAPMAVIAVIAAAAAPMLAQPLPADFAERADKAPIKIAVPPDAVGGWSPRPLIIALHGEGSEPADIFPAFRALASRVGAVLAVPQAVDPAGNGFSWDTPAKADFIVLRAIGQARRRAPVDRGRIVLAGFSQGASMTYHVALRHPDLFKGVMPIAGVYDQERTPIPLPPPKQWPRFAILCGGEDRLVDESRRAATLLEEAGAPVTIRILEGVGHRLLQKSDLDELRLALEALLR
jgi:predicted esterase